MDCICTGETVRVLVFFVFLSCREWIIFVPFSVDVILYEITFILPSLPYCMVNVKTRPTPLTRTLCYFILINKTH